VEVSRPATTATNISQEMVMIPANDWAKREALRRLIREAEPTLQNAIVFCNRKRDVDVVAKSLVKHGFDAAPIHGDLDQSLRTRTLEKFRAGELKILVASDVAARGLDVPGVSHIFNFDVPIHADDYVHRIGRTGRAGRSGLAYMLATSRDGKYVEAIERLTGNKLVRREMMDIEVREERKPPRGEHGRGGRDHGRSDKDKRHRDRRPPGAKFHDHVAPMEPVAVSETAAPAPVEAPRPAESRSAEQRPQEQRPQQQRHQEPRGPRREHSEKRAHEKHAHEKHERPQSQKQHNARAAESETVDKSQLPAFLFRPVPGKKPE
jgi:superfamily II DNA/RNA helicase